MPYICFDKESYEVITLSVSRKSLKRHCKLVDLTFGISQKVIRENSQWSDVYRDFLIKNIFRVNRIILDILVIEFGNMVWTETSLSHGKELFRELLCPGVEAWLLPDTWVKVIILICK